MSQQPLSSRATPSERPERRTWVRYPCPLEAPCRDVESDTETGWWARILDVSRGGIGVSLGWPVRVGAILSIDLPTGPDGRPCAVPMRVVYTNEAAPGAWATGCQFLQPLRDEELQSLLMQIACSVLPDAATC